jgi:hypothetical protein
MPNTNAMLPKDEIDQLDDRIWGLREDLLRCYYCEPTQKDYESQLETLLDFRLYAAASTIPNVDLEKLATFYAFWFHRLYVIREIREQDFKVVLNKILLKISVYWEHLHLPSQDILREIDEYKNTLTQDK